MDLSALVGKLLEEHDGDVLREGIRVLSQALMETEVAGLIGPDRHERTPERSGHRSKRRCDSRHSGERIGGIPTQRDLQFVVHLFSRKGRLHASPSRPSSRVAHAGEESDAADRGRCRWGSA